MFVFAAPHRSTYMYYDFVGGCLFVVECRIFTLVQTNTSTGLLWENSIELVPMELP